MKKVRVAIVDDHSLFREGMSALLNEESTVQICIKAANGRDFLDQLKDTYQTIDVLLLDMEMPIMNGRETLEIIKMRHPHIKVLLLTMHNEDSFIVEMINRGANGFLLKDNSLETVLDAITCVKQTDFYFNTRMRQALNNHNSIKQSTEHKTGIDFTLRELDVIKMICQEMTNKEISDNLKIGVRTVETHRNNIISKIGCRNTAGIALYAIKNNLV